MIIDRLQLPDELRARWEAARAEAEGLAEAVKAARWGVPTPGGLVAAVAAFKFANKRLEQIGAEIDVAYPPDAAELERRAVDDAMCEVARETKRVLAESAKLLATEPLVDRRYRAIAAQAGRFAAKHLGLAAPPPITFFNDPGSTHHGYWNPRAPERIHVRLGLSDEDLVRTVMHETAHAARPWDMSESSAKSYEANLFELYRAEHGRHDRAGNWQMIL